MALKMTYTTKDSVVYPESYWKITKVVADYMTPRYYIRIFGYSDENAKIEGDSPIDCKVYYMGTVLDGEETLMDVGLGVFESLLDSGSRSALYDLLKSNVPIFLESVDC